MGPGEEMRPLAMASAIALATVCALSVALAQERPGRPGRPGRGREWRFTIKTNQTATSQITADNTCHKRHRFEVDAQNLPSFMHLLGDPHFLVDSHRKHDFPVQLNSQGL